MRILFLDIDGVLNSRASLIGIGDSIPDKSPCKVILSSVAIGLLKEICKECEMRIYIHSTWVGSHCDEAWFESVFAKYNFPVKILKILPIDRDRNKRIQSAIDHYKPKEYVVLDDSTACQVFGKNFIQVNNCDGLGWEHYVRILQRFGKDIPLILM